MTNAEAIEVLEVHKAHWERLLDNGICDVLEGGNTIQALKVAIRALKNEQSEQNAGMCQQNVGEMSEKQTDEDLISRQAVLDEIEYELGMINSALDSMTLDFNARERLRQRRGEAREILNSIQVLPSVTPHAK